MIDFRSANFRRISPCWFSEILYSYSLVLSALSHISQHLYILTCPSFLTAGVFSQLSSYLPQLPSLARVIVSLILAFFSRDYPLPFPCRC